jgi:hypothetical protein
LAVSLCAVFCVSDSSCVSWCGGGGGAPTAKNNANIPEPSDIVSPTSCT